MGILSNAVRCAALLLPLLSTAGPATVYDRPLAIVWANSGGLALPYNETQLLARFDQVTNNLTSVIPFFLNVKDTTPHNHIIRSVKQRGITIIPAVGAEVSQGPINQKSFRDIATGYRNFTNYIRLEGLQGYYEAPGGPAQIQDMIDFLTLPQYGLQFNHIMMNPWPRLQGGGVAHFSNVQVDSSIDQVLTDFNRSEYPYHLKNNPTNWYPNMVHVRELRDYRPSAAILINYENKPQHILLRDIELQDGTSKGDLNITLTQCLANGLHWTPPFSENYDPIALGTWPYIARALSSVQ